MKNILAADIGGTNARFGHFSWEKNHDLKLEESIWLKTKESSSFKDILDKLFSEKLSLVPRNVDIAVFAAAGPVEDGAYCQPTQVGWDIRTEDIHRHFGLANSFIINDFVAQAYALKSPIAEKAAPILSGKKNPDFAMAVIGAGTGLGHATVMPDWSGGYVVIPSEGGHAAVAFETREEFEYARFVEKEAGIPYATGDYVISGHGLTLVHAFLTGEKLSPEEAAVHLTQDSKTLRWLSRFYARRCRNFALYVLARGGVYIAGGVAAKDPQLVTHPVFEETFRSSATMKHILDEIPVFLMNNQESGLWGAASCAVQRLHVF